MKRHYEFFYSTILFTIAGLFVGFGVGYFSEGNLEGGLTALFLTVVLAILEISLSFDNAIVNATVLRGMTPKWRHRFMTWGIWLAVFGMRIVFPIAVVSVIGEISPIKALEMATFEPHKYALVMASAHIPLAGFGGAFLAMVAFKFFLDSEKSSHWLYWPERAMTRLGHVPALDLGICLGLIYLLSIQLGDAQAQMSLLGSGVLGVISFILVEGIGEFLHAPTQGKLNLERASAALFVYLEVLDASFSFDGVIGAFALTTNLFIIATGLGIGALFVRSLTLMLVRKNTLDRFVYLEHGAFYAIGALSALMLTGIFVHVPEVITGLVGAVVIAASVVASLKSAPAERST